MNPSDAEKYSLRNGSDNTRLSRNKQLIHLFIDQSMIDWVLKQ